MGSKINIIGPRELVPEDMLICTLQLINHTRIKLVIMKILKNLF